MTCLETESQRGPGTFQRLSTEVEFELESMCPSVQGPVWGITRLLLGHAEDLGVTVGCVIGLRRLTFSAADWVKSADWWDAHIHHGRSQDEARNKPLASQQALLLGKDGGETLILLTGDKSQSRALGACPEYVPSDGPGKICLGPLLPCPHPF